MTAYVIADLQVTDPVGYEKYREGARATIAAWGGRYLARGGAVEVLEGDWVPRRTVVVEFPSLAQVRAWYDSPEYRRLREIRQRASTGRMVVVEGL